MTGHMSSICAMKRYTQSDKNIPHYLVNFKYSMIQIISINAYGIENMPGWENKTYWGNNLVNKLSFEMCLVSKFRIFLFR